MSILRNRLVESVALALTAMTAMTGCAADGNPGSIGFASGSNATAGLFSAPPVAPARQPGVTEYAARTAPMPVHATPKPTATATQAGFYSSALGATPASHVQSTPTPSLAYVASKPEVVARPSLVVLPPNVDLVEEIVKRSDGIVLIDFYADWCGPCRRQGAILHEMEGTAAKNGASIIKVDVDQHEALAARLQVESLPTIIVIKDGQITHRKTGLADSREIAALLST